MNSIDLVIKIGSMALIQKDDNVIDYNVFQRLGNALRPGMLLVTSGAAEIGRLDYIQRTGCELGGMTSAEVMYRAMQLTVENNPDVKAIIVVLIGGFNRMDNMATGLTTYCKEHNVNIPIFCRMCGTMEEEGIRIMQENGFTTFNVLTETVEAIAKAVKEG